MNRAFNGSKQGVSGLLFKRYVKLPTWLKHFPRAFEPRWDDKMITRPQGLGVTFSVTQYRNALHNFTIFMLSEIDLPLAHVAFPHAGI